MLIQRYLDMMPPEFTVHEVESITLKGRLMVSNLVPPEPDDLLGVTHSHEKE